MTDGEVIHATFSWLREWQQSSRHTESLAPMCFEGPWRLAGWMRQHRKELVKIPKTNSRFLQFLPWAHPHTDAVLILTAREWEWGKGLELAGWERRGGSICMRKAGPGWETMGWWTLDGVGKTTQSPDANLTGIYDIIVHRLLCQTVKSAILLLVLKKIMTCYLEKTQTWKGSIE